jgi:hypothetical protein
VVALSDELDRLTSGHALGEQLGNLMLVWMHFTSDGDAEGVIVRAREVMLCLAGLPSSAFLDLETADCLPLWFTSAFAPEPASGAVDLDDERWLMSGWLS